MFFKRKETEWNLKSICKIQERRKTKFTTAIPHETAVDCVAIKNPRIKAGKCIAVTINSRTDIKNCLLLCPVNSPNNPGNVWINHWKFVAGFKPTSQSKPPNMNDVVEESKQYTNANKVKEVNVKDWTCS